VDDEQPTPRATPLALECSIVHRECRALGPQGEGAPSLASSNKLAAAPPSYAARPDAQQQSGNAEKQYRVQQEKPRLPRCALVVPTTAAQRATRQPRRKAHGPAALERHSFPAIASGGDGRQLFNDI
jgi:hypothetical protein